MVVNDNEDDGTEDLATGGALAVTNDSTTADNLVDNDGLASSTGNADYRKFCFHEMFRIDVSPYLETITWTALYDRACGVCQQVYGLCRQVYHL